MFTGIIRGQGELVAVRPRGTGAEILVAGVPADWQLGLGDSVAVDGPCLTVEALLPQGVQFYLSAETLGRTTAGDWNVGRRVHLEPALRVGEALGGHIVQGHVDGVGTVQARQPVGEDLRLRVTVPAELAPAMVSKGSVALDGVSLTINERDERTITVNLIPHTLSMTHLGELDAGDTLNVEADPIAKQVAELVGRMTAGEARS